MLRLTYLAVLLSLQVALAGVVAPPLANLLAAHVATAAGRAPLAAATVLAATMLAAVGLAVVLAFPVFAFARHRQRGAPRFRGVPRWAVGVAIAGTAMLAAAVALQLARPLLPIDARMGAIFAARAATTAAVALMAAGVLCGEVLRRGVAPFAAIRAHPLSAGVEVALPPDPRTRAAWPPSIQESPMSVARS